MEKIKFQSALFGFKRRQVLQYVNQTCQGYEQQLSSQAQAFEQYQTQTQATLQELSKELESSREVCAQSKAQVEGLQGQLEQKEQSLSQAAQLADDLLNRLQAQGASLSAMEQTLAQKEGLIAQKDTVIAKQAVEVSRLQQQVSQLEAQFEQLRGQNEQSTALVNCLNVLHGRNRQLISQVAVLETKLEDVTHGEQVEEHKKTAQENNQMISSTEQLFAQLRKEIGDALESISTKIESGGIRDTDDGNYYVDMANL